jgi:hypothetical protein
MGGRGRNQESKDRWDWVKELSDSRLEGYGKMSLHWLDIGGNKPITDHSKEALNWACAKEFERRQGVTPEWKM